MKVALICLVALSTAVAYPERRFFIDSLINAFDSQTLKADLQLMADVLGGDPTEAACEKECHMLLQEGHVLNYGCPLVCRSFQSLLKLFAVTEAPVSPN